MQYNGLDVSVTSFFAELLVGIVSYSQVLLKVASCGELLSCITCNLDLFFCLKHLANTITATSVTITTITTPPDPTTPPMVLMELNGSGAVTAVIVVAAAAPSVVVDAASSAVVVAAAVSGTKKGLF